MRLTVKNKDGQVREYVFREDPIHIGRGPNCNIQLPDRTVSKDHAVVFSTEDGQWVIEDQDSANKTFLNGQPLHHSPIKTGDCIRITDFLIEVDLDEAKPEESLEAAEDTLHLEASLTTPKSETVVRKPDAGHAPAMRLPAKRLTDFSQATDAIAQAATVEDLLMTLLGISIKQFGAFHVWAALREQPNGPMTYHAGKRRDGKPVELGEIPLAEKINQAVDKGLSMVLPCVSAEMEGKERIRSAMIASIVGPSGCYGVIYADNAMIHDHFSLSDLDYLMFIAVHTSAVLKHLLKE